MYVITANVRYYSNGPLVPSFLAFDTARNMFVWDDESAEFFGRFQDASAFIDDFSNKRIGWACYFGIEDVKVKEVKILDV